MCILALSVCAVHAVGEGGQRLALGHQVGQRDAAENLADRVVHLAPERLGRAVPDPQAGLVVVEACDRSQAAFEQFDEGGRFREMDNGVPTSAASSVKIGDVYWEFNDALEFIELAANSELAKQCVARNVSRYAFGWANDRTEQGFVGSAWAALPAERQTQLDDVIVSLVESDLFIKRRAQ